LVKWYILILDNILSNIFFPYNIYHTQIFTLDNILVKSGRLLLVRVAGKSRVVTIGGNVHCAVRITPRSSGGKTVQQTQKMFCVHVILGSQTGIEIMFFYKITSAANSIVRGPTSTGSKIIPVTYYIDGVLDHAVTASEV
jgi:hypothetical protein